MKPRFVRRISRSPAPAPLAARRFGVAPALLAAVLSTAPAVRAADPAPVSAAEQALFVDDHLARVRPPTTLHYAYRKRGSLEAAFDDTVDVVLAKQPDGTCCTSSAKFLSGARATAQPAVDGVKSNPAILYFLERDIREMERLTKGKANYFRKRIRLAVFQGATMRNIDLPYRHGTVAVREIAIAPYLDDPNRARFEQLATKRYVFLLSNAVPGGLYGIRTQVDGASAGAPPLIAEDMLIEGAGAASSRRRKP